PVDGMWSAWAAWSHCSVTRSGGVKDRGRVCSHRSSDGQSCEGPSVEVQKCYEVGSTRGPELAFTHEEMSGLGLTLGSAPQVELGAASRFA
ncbi:hypothetical protein RRG08_014319, partial [Elysia crispata]